MPVVDPATPAPTWRLSPEGIESCAGLADGLAAHAPSALYSSEEPKALQTAEQIGLHLGLSAVPRGDLHENDRSGFSFIADPEAFRARFQAFFERADERVIGRESAAEAERRFLGALGAIASRHASEATVVVAHGTVITLAVTRHNDVDPLNFWESLDLPSFVVLELPTYAWAGGSHAPV